MTTSGRTEGERPSVGVVAPDRDADAVVNALADVGDVVTGPEATDATLVVAVGNAALASLADARTSTPVVPVETGFGQSADAVGTEVERLLAGTDETRQRPVLRVETPTETTHAVFDVVLMAAEPATISGFSVAAGGPTAEGLEPVAEFRADGVAVATPAGSHGYARAAGGPVVVPGTDAAAVVPVAPFSTDPEHWVVPLASVSVTVERDVDVRVTADGRSLGTVPPGSEIRLVRDGVLRVVVPVAARTTGSSESY